MKVINMLTTKNGVDVAKNSRKAARSQRTFFCASNDRKKIFVVSTFTPCAGWVRLLETGNLTARSAAFGDVILLSQAWSGLDQFRHQPKAEEVSLRGTLVLADAIGGVSFARGPNTQTAGNEEFVGTYEIEKKVSNLHRGFLRQNPGAKTQPKPTSQERTPTSANQP